MIKKAVFLASLLASAYAVPTVANPSFYKPGFLVGAHVGTSFGSGRFDGVLDLNVVGSVPTTASGKDRKTSPLLGIFAGYRHVFSEGYTLGADISANFLVNDEMKKEITHVEVGIGGVNLFPFVNKLSRQYSIVPSVSFGKVICGHFHAYVSLGLVVSRFKQTVIIVDADNASLKASQTKLGFVPAVGVEYAVTPNVSVLGNVSYEIYGKASKNFDISSATGLPGATYASSIRPRYLTLKVGAAYRF